MGVCCIVHDLFKLTFNLQATSTKEHLIWADIDFSFPFVTQLKFKLNISNMPVYIFCKKIKNSCNLTVCAHMSIFGCIAKYYFLFFQNINVRSDFLSIKNTIENDHCFERYVDVFQGRHKIKLLSCDCENLLSFDFNRIECVPNSQIYVLHSKQPTKINYSHDHRRCIDDIT